MSNVDIPRQATSTFDNHMYHTVCSRCPIYNL